MPTLEETKNYLKTSEAIASAVFYELQSTSDIEKYFPLTESKKLQQVLREYIYYRIFLVDYESYNTLGDSEARMMILDSFYEKTRDFFADEECQSLFGFNIGTMKMRMATYTEIYKKANFDDSAAIGYSCAKILTLAGLELDVDFTGKDYAEFRLQFFQFRIAKFTEFLDNVLTVAIGGTVEKASKNSGCLYKIIFIFLAIAFLQHILR